jgi:carboxymethylenebutenolidase
MHHRADAPMGSRAPASVPRSRHPVAECHDIVIPSSDDRTAPALFAPVPRADGPRPGVLVLHEALGLTDDLRRIVTRFADEGFVALAPDFLHGLGPRPLCIARFARGLGAPATGRPYRQLELARRWLAASAEVAGSGIGVAGYCMGGGFALLYAAGAEIEAVAPFYGAVPRDAEALRGICPVVASFGGRDGPFASGADRLERHLTELGVEHDVRTYPDAGHGFMSRHDGVVGWLGARLPMHLGHDPVAAEDAWSRTILFFRNHLAGGGADGSRQGLAPGLAPTT